MSIRIAMTDLENCLGRNYETNRDRARDLDNSTRLFHRYIWLLRAERRYVLEVVIPLFEEAISVLQQTQEKGENREYIENVAETIRLRIKNLDTCMRGKLSDYIPVEQLRQTG